jgi:hypothetical protein
MPRVKPIVESEDAVKIFITPDGHTLAFVGNRQVHFINAVTLDLVSSVKCPRAFQMKMTNYHAFIKHYDQGDEEWTIISFKNTRYLRNHECKVKLSDSARLQHIISNDELKDVFAIYAPSINPYDED